MGSNSCPLTAQAIPHREDDAQIETHQTDRTHVVSHKVVEVGHHQKGPEESSGGDEEWQRISTAFPATFQSLWGNTIGRLIENIQFHAVPPLKACRVSSLMVISRVIFTIFRWEQNRRCVCCCGDGSCSHLAVSAVTLSKQFERDSRASRVYWATCETQ